jgi:hypothetical protein
MAFESATAALCRLAFGQGADGARRRPAFVVGQGGEIGRTNRAGSRSSAISSWMQVSPLRSVVFHTAQPSRAVPNSS